jgi:hypothetical protein
MDNYVRSFLFGFLLRFQLFPTFLDLYKFHKKVFWILKLETFKFYSSASEQVGHFALFGSPYRFYTSNAKSKVEPSLPIGKVDICQGPQIFRAPKFYNVSKKVFK